MAISLLAQANLSILCSQQNRLRILRRQALPSTTRNEPKIIFEPLQSNNHKPASLSTRSEEDDDSSLVSTWAHRACLASGCTAVGMSLARCIETAASSHHWAEPVLGAALGYVLADLGTGLYHWGIDNYGDLSLPFVGPQIERAQGHHVWPNTIARRHVANNLHAAAVGVAILVFPLDFMCSDSGIHGFVGVFATCVMFSQQFHAWAHTSRAKLPPLVVGLQKMGLLLSQERHAVHHRGSNDSGYCIVNGLWNKFLDDDFRVFKALEMFLFARFGIRPKYWDKLERQHMEESELRC